MHMMNGVGDVDDVIRSVREVQIFSARNDALQLDSMFPAEAERHFHHLRGNVHGRDLSTLKRKVNRGFAESRADVKKLLAAEGPHTAQNKAVLEGRGGFDAFAHQYVF